MVANGDVLTDLDLTALVGFHRDRGARMTLALHPVDDPSRYGVVATDPDGAVSRVCREAGPGHHRRRHDQRGHLRRRAGRARPDPARPGRLGRVRGVPRARRAPACTRAASRATGATSARPRATSARTSSGCRPRALSIPPHTSIRPPRCTPPWSARAAASRPVRASRRRCFWPAQLWRKAGRWRIGSWERLEHPFGNGRRPVRDGGCDRRDGGAVAAGGAGRRGGRRDVALPGAVVDRARWAARRWAASSCARWSPASARCRSRASAASGIPHWAGPGHARRCA